MRNKLMKIKALAMAGVMSLKASSGKIALASGFNSIGESSTSNNTAEPSYSGVSDFIKGYDLVNGDSMVKAGVKLSGFSNLVSYFISGAIIVFAGLQAVQSVLDLFYLGIPISRTLLDGSRFTSVDANGVPMPGRQIVSDEALKALQLAGCGSMAQAQQMNGGSFGGMGMGMGHNGYRTGMGGYGGMGSYGGIGTMGGYGGMGAGMQGANQGMQQPSKKLAISVYLRMRLFAVILSALSLIVLTSSIVMGCGMNLGEWLLNVVSGYLK